LKILKHHAINVELEIGMQQGGDGIHRKRSVISVPRGYLCIFIPFVVPPDAETVHTALLSAAKATSVLFLSR
jgi:hypothetical protein